MCIFFRIYAYINLYIGEIMAVKLVRKSYYVDQNVIKKAKKILGVQSEAEAIRISVRRMLEMSEYWEFMDKTSNSLKKGSFR